MSQRKKKIKQCQNMYNTLTQKVSCVRHATSNQTCWEITKKRKNYKKRKLYNCINTLYSSSYCKEMHPFKIIAHNLKMHLIKLHVFVSSTCQGAKIISDWYSRLIFELLVDSKIPTALWCYDCTLNYSTLIQNNSTIMSAY